MASMGGIVRRANLSYCGTRNSDKKNMKKKYQKDAHPYSDKTFGGTGVILYPKMSFEKGITPMERVGGYFIIW